MKKYFATFAVLLIASSASAGCYNIVNGQGPDRIGNVFLAGPTSQVCLQTNQYGESTLQLSDSQGALAIAGISQLSAARCGGNCQIAILSQGNANGEPANFSGTTVEISTQQDPELHVVKGTLKITAGRDFPQTYILLGSPQY
jgi:predicted small secreted protein